MKDSRFIELLNLYVDHEISAEDARLLETEIQQHPRRRQVYREYCQIQKACVLLTDKFRTEAPAADGKVVEFAPRRRWLTPVTYASTGLVALAACVALVLVNRSGNEASPKADAAVAATQVRQSLAVAKAQPVRPALQPVFSGLVRDTTLQVSFTTSDRAPFDWMHQVQFERVPTQELRFESLQTAPIDDLMFRNRRVFQSQTEGAAFRFQK